MFKYNNNHIFTGYLKQFLSTFNLPTCKIYTTEYAKYVAEHGHGQEDPRVLTSFNTLGEDTKYVHINYLKNNSLYSYFINTPSIDNARAVWRQIPGIHYDSTKTIRGFTKTLNSPGISYDTKTHEYLGDYLRFLRDYNGVNLMSLYNCYNDKVCNNLYFPFTVNNKSVLFNSQDANYRIYAIPVKLFAEYTIAIDSNQGIELFCGLYNTKLDVTDQAINFAKKTYTKINKTLFNQPELFSKLSLDNWMPETDFIQSGNKTEIRSDIFTRWELLSREHDLKLFIKVPASCRSTITILEGDYRAFNSCLYDTTEAGELTYKRNHTILNFNTAKKDAKVRGDEIDLNNYKFKPISKLQLLAINTGESYPFADRLVEYLSGSVITPVDEIHDNIMRVQRVMRNNKHYSKIEGLWENKIQNILYDYTMCSGPMDLVTICDNKNCEFYLKEVSKDHICKTKQVLKDRRQGYHHRLGHNSKSTQFDILGYADKDVEKIYASWKKANDNVQVGSSLQSIDIYDGLYDI